MRRAAAAVAVSLFVLFGSSSSAQSLTYSLLERYMESLRVQAGIPGLSALILQDGVVVWERGFGRSDIERAIDATPITPYVVGGLSQMFGGTLLLKECVDENSGTLNDRVVRWNPFYPEPTTTLAQLLGHVSPTTGTYELNLTRFAALTPVIEECAKRGYPQLLVEEILSRLGLVDTVPGTALGLPTPADFNTFGQTNLLRYAAVLSRVAAPYRVDTRGRAIRAEVPLTRVNAATGLVSTVQDLARFDATLRYDVLLRRETLVRAWTNVAPGFPTALGWFHQLYNGTPVVWQFGVVPGAYSSLLLKLPTRGVTLILLANSDGLNVPSTLEQGDVTASVFARTFLRVYVP